jgi:Flp pilus assembly CpaF family ATPase
MSESRAKLESALGPLTDLLDDPRIVEVMLNVLVTPFARRGSVARDVAMKANPGGHQ